MWQIYFFIFSVSPLRSQRLMLLPLGPIGGSVAPCQLVRRGLNPYSETPRRHHFPGQSTKCFYFFVHNGGWRILTGQISDLVEKENI